ncbi:MAG: MaoC family dehydratase N-terminal domain-containing protein [Rugosibacter sp.]|jgi:3-methylfumaryl-CoA hydratase|nr:MaoC family dehydratase N-terminal domain-containing protein [Rugosibacter sp.]
MAVDIEYLKQWAGRSETVQDVLHAKPLVLFSAMLDRQDSPPKAGDEIPPFWHGLYFLTATRQSELGADGHPPRGGFLPPVPLPRRMFAGAQVDFVRPLHVEQAVERRSTILGVSQKQGRSGEMVFLQLQHEISDAAGVCVVETQDIVYREDPGSATANAQAAPTIKPSATAPQGHLLRGVSPAPTFPAMEALWSRTIVPDPVLLFRYSALTFIGHRIHYDYPYTTEVEGYPGLVVHGPLQATLLLDLLRRELPQCMPQRFVFRAVNPLFCTGAFRVCGAPSGEGQYSLWIEDQLGNITMQATAQVTIAEKISP